MSNKTTCPVLHYLAAGPELEDPAGPGDDQLELVASGGRDEGHGEAAVELGRPRLVDLQKRIHSRNVLLNYLLSVDNEGVN